MFSRITTFTSVKNLNTYISILQKTYRDIGLHMRIKIVPLFYTEILKLEILKYRYFMQCLFYNSYTQLGIRECNHRFFLLQYI